jgi:hypothetical protein
MGHRRRSGYAARVFAQTSLPYRDPGNVPVETATTGTGAA